MSLDISTREYSGYLQVDLNVNDDAQFDLGFHNLQQAQDLRENLYQAMTEVNDYILAELAKAEGETP